MVASFPPPLLPLRREEVLLVADIARELVYEFLVLYFFCSFKISESKRETSGVFPKPANYLSTTMVNK
jgi:hypothetical protein